MVNEESEHYVESQERRASWRELHALVLEIQHEFDKRISIVEVRMNGQDDRLGNIEADLRETNHGVQRVLQVLNAHVEQEQKERGRLLLGVIATLLSVLGYAGAQLLQYLLK